jgi:DEAD/DEAH box helicase domain-containing protein
MSPTLPFHPGASSRGNPTARDPGSPRSGDGRPGSPGKEQALTDALARLGAARAQLAPVPIADVSDVADVADTAHVLQASPAVAADQVITAVHRLAPVAAAYAPFPDAVDARLRRALRQKGIEQPYTHQAAAMDHALAGRSLVIVTPTASGKTLCYNGPVLSQILSDPSSRALYLFPTKALAQDQLAELYSLTELLARGDEGDGDDGGGAGDAGKGGEAPPQIGVFTYDGDTPQDARRAIRTRAHIVLSNPDMLHSGILPHHPRWAKLFENLKFVVIDELHAYRGVFGSHLANILRRLRRICRHYGSDPVFICTSATIANPVDLAERLTERTMALVDTSGAPRGEKFFVFLNPPVVNVQLGIRRSYLSEARRVALEFLRRNLQIILFAQSRLATEILTTYLKDACQGDPGAPDIVRGYRGGYLPNRRREIERGLREGSVRAVVSTSALELGIDIGALDVSIMAGYPGTIAATWQRAGRAGRRAGRSAAVLVASSAPLDQFVVRHPSYFFDASPEHALINPDNLQILLDHVKCGAFELPFTADEQFGREDLQQILGVLAEERFVHQAEGTWHWTHESYPADAVSLRSVSSDNFVIVDTTRDTRIIGETDYTSAPSTLHEKAIYIMEGQLFQVEKLDFEGRKAYVQSVDCDYYTDAITYSKVTILDQFNVADTLEPAADAADAADAAAVVDDEAGGGEGDVTFDPAVFDPAALEPEAFEPAGVDSASSDASSANGSHGEVHVVSRVVGFKKIKFYTNENVGSGELDLPEQQMHTTSYWLTISAPMMGALPYAMDDRRDGVNGLAYAMRNVAQLLLMCDRQDLGLSVDTGGNDTAAGLAKGGAAISPVGATAGGSTPMGDPHIFIYDNYPGGIGFSAPLFRMQHDLLAGARELVVSCPCENGCPSCVGPVGETGPLSKRVALDLLDRMMTGAGAVAPPVRLEGVAASSAVDPF